MKESHVTENYLFDQMVIKALLITQGLFPGYNWLFMFNNVLSRFIDVKNIL